MQSSAKPRLLITGGSGFLGGNLAANAPAHWETFATYNSSPVRSGGAVRWLQLDVTNIEVVEKTIDSIKPEVMIHAAAITDSGICERHSEAAWETNVKGTENVAYAAERVGAKLVYTSTDMVFGRGREFSAEDDPPSPTTVYSSSKAAAEKIVIAASSKHVVARICLSYGRSANSAQCFTERIIENLDRGIPAKLFVDEYRTPIYVRDLCRILLEFSRREDLTGLFHVGGPDRLSRYEFGLKICRVFAFSSNLLIPVSVDDIPFDYDRPRDCSLSIENLVKSVGFSPRNVEEGLEDMKSGHIY